MEETATDVHTITTASEVYSAETSQIALDPFTAPIDLMTLSSHSSGIAFPEEEKYLPYMYVLTPLSNAPKLETNFWEHKIAFFCLQTPILTLTP